MSLSRPSCTRRMRYMDTPSDQISDDDIPPMGTGESAQTMAERGDAEAQFGMGLRFANAGDAPGFAQAAHWYLKAAAQNHALAQYNLSVMYFRGQGVPRDKAASLVWI